MVDGNVEQALASGLVQPDPTTCGSCVLVVARMLSDPAFADFLVDGASPGAGERAAGSLHDRFRQQSLAMHRLTNGFEDSAGGWQPPWPRALGTPPWALAREMTNRSGEAGRTYHARPVVPSRRAGLFVRIALLAGAGQAVPLYVGNRWSPRHVVLVLPTDDAQSDLLIYDPASGHRYQITGNDFSTGCLQVAGWHVPWVVVLPSWAGCGPVATASD